MRYDWNRYGKPRTALVNRVGGWMLTDLAAVMCPLLLWLAVTRDWTIIFVALLLASCTVVQRIAVRKVYGVREVRPPEPRQAHAEAVAVAIEVRRRQQWDAITKQAYRARPPDPKRLAASAGTALGESLSPSMAGMAFGFARIAAATGGCAHPDAEPVDLLVTGERVAWTCPDCPAELPADWR